MRHAPGRTTAAMGLVLAVLLASCTSEPAASSPEASPAASPSPTPLPTIGLPADDGARIVEVETIDDRTRDLTIDSPAVGSLAAGADPRDLWKVRILLPGAFETQPDALWPSLYLLHGGPGTYTDWTDLTDVEELTASTDLLVVMPAAGDGGWYSDWWNDGQGGMPMWETFHTVELPQLMERNWHASERRAVAGLSMGGYGAMAYAAGNPGVFVAAASYSGVLSTVAVADDLQQFIDPAVWGDPQAQADVWQAHDPVFLADALSGTTLYVSYGDGTPGPFDNGAVSDEDPEAWIAAQNETFLARLTELAIPVTVDAYGPGSHDWPYWERALHNSLPLLLEALAG